VVTTGYGDVDAEASVEGYLAEIYGPRVYAAVTVGPPRANRKPVLQVLDSRGATLGYVKVGWNDLTRRLVCNEAAALGTISRCDLRLLRPPTVVDHRVWAGLELLATSPLPLPGWRDHRRGTVPLAAMAELAGCPSPPTPTAWADSGFAAQLAERVARANSADWLPELAGVVTAMQERADGTVLSFGSWHGDWTDRNMGWSRSRLSLWDWERFGSGVPVGFDVAHYLLQRQLVREGPRDEVVAAVCSTEVPRVLRGLGLSPRAAVVVTDAYLLEIILRYATDAAASHLRLRRLAAQLCAVLAARLERA